MAIIGVGSHNLEFFHPMIGSLVVRTGADSIGWGYELNTANYPTYGGEVVQILSCFISNLTVEGTLQSYLDYEDLYTYFLNYLQISTQGDQSHPIPGKSSYNQEPMTLRYPHRGWEFQIIPMNVPAFRMGREVVAPQWKIEAFVVDDAGDAAELKDLVVSEAEIAMATNNPGESFGLQGVIKFVEDNPFSDPNTKFGKVYDPTNNVNQIADNFAKLIPSYLSGNFDSVFGGIGSKPAFNPKPGSKGTTDKNAVVDKAAQQQADKIKKVTKAKKR